MITYPGDKGASTSPSQQQRTLRGISGFPQNRHEAYSSVIFRQWTSILAALQRLNRHDELKLGHVTNRNCLFSGIAQDFDFYEMKSQL